MDCIDFGDLRLAPCVWRQRMPLAPFPDSVHPPMVGWLAVEDAAARALTRWALCVDMRDTAHHGVDAEAAIFPYYRSRLEAVRRLEDHS